MDRKPLAFHTRTHAHLLLPNCCLTNGYFSKSYSNNQLLQPNFAPYFSHYNCLHHHHARSRHFLSD